MNLNTDLETAINFVDQIPHFIGKMPITQLFIAGVFAVIMTEVIKQIIGLTESNIGFHNTDGKLIKTRTAALIYSSIILLSNVLSYAIYEGSKQVIPNILNQSIIDSLFILASITGVWIYLKSVHYYRS